MSAAQDASTSECPGRRSRTSATALAGTTSATQRSSRFLNAVERAFDTFTEAPDRWPLVNGLSPNRRMRYYVMAVFPYTVVYQRRDEDLVEIVAVAHQKRRRYWERRRR